LELISQIISFDFVSRYHFGLVGALLEIAVVQVDFGGKFKKAFPPVPLISSFPLNKKTQQKNFHQILGKKSRIFI
jgi:hypothetical protein